MEPSNQTDVLNTTKFVFPAHLTNIDVVRMTDHSQNIRTNGHSARFIVVGHKNAFYVSITGKLLFIDISFGW